MTRSLGVAVLSYVLTPLPPHTITKVLQRWHTTHLQVNQRPFHHLKLPAQYALSQSETALPLLSPFAHEKATP